MTTPWDPTDRLEQAALEIEFAIKLMSYFENGHVEKAVFDCDTIVLLNGGSISFRDGGFHTADDLVLGAQNVWSRAAGAASLAMDSALKEHGIRNDPEDLSRRGQIRSLVYMIRCAFAHDSQTPKWRATGQYKRVLEFDLNGRHVRVDVAALHDKKFDLADIGGELVFWDLLAEVRGWVSDA